MLNDEYSLDSVPVGNYKGFKFKTPEWAYSYGQGETRIGKNKKNNDPKQSHEILIIKE